MISTIPVSPPTDLTEAICNYRRFWLFVEQADFAGHTPKLHLICDGLRRQGLLSAARFFIFPKTRVCVLGVDKLAVPLATLREQIAGLIPKGRRASRMIFAASIEEAVAPYSVLLGYAGRVGWKVREYADDEGGRVPKFYCLTIFPPDYPEPSVFTTFTGTAHGRAGSHGKRPKGEKRTICNNVRCRRHDESDGAAPRWTRGEPMPILDSIPPKFSVLIGPDKASFTLEAIAAIGDEAAALCRDFEAGRDAKVQTALSDARQAFLEVASPAVRRQPREKARSQKWAAILNG